MMVEEVASARIKRLRRGARLVKRLRKKPQQRLASVRLPHARSRKNNVIPSRLRQMPSWLKTYRPMLTTKRLISSSSMTGRKSHSKASRK